VEGGPQGSTFTVISTAGTLLTVLYSIPSWVRNAELYNLGVSLGGGGGGGEGGDNLFYSVHEYFSESFRSEYPHKKVRKFAYQKTTWGLFGGQSLGNSEIFFSADCELLEKPPCCIENHWVSFLCNEIKRGLG
jgi:hypothetical protein